MMITYKQLFITKFNLKVTVVQYLIYTFILVSRIDFHRALGPCLSSLLKYENILFGCTVTIEMQMRKYSHGIFFPLPSLALKVVHDFWYWLIKLSFDFFIFSNSYQQVSLYCFTSYTHKMAFPVVMYGCESWTMKKAEHRRTDAFELWCWRRLLRVSWTGRRANQSILKEISPGCSLEGLMLKLKLQYFAHLMQRVDSLEKTLMLGKIEGRRRKGW